LIWYQHPPQKPKPAKANQQSTPNTNTTTKQHLVGKSLLTPTLIDVAGSSATIIVYRISTPPSTIGITQHVVIRKVDLPPTSSTGTLAVSPSWAWSSLRRNRC
jgi:hypothetical protein